MAWNTWKLVAFSGIILLASCSSNESKLIGTWVPLGPDGKKSDMMKITFLKGNKIVSTSSFDVKDAHDTVTYALKEDGKLLVTKEKSGREDELVIVSLTDKALTMCLKKDNRDTMRFVKEQ